MPYSFPEEVYFLSLCFPVQEARSDKGNPRTVKYDVLAHKMLTHQIHTGKNAFPLLPL